MASSDDRMAIHDATITNEISTTMPVDEKKGPDAVVESDSSSDSGAKDHRRYKEYNEAAFDQSEDPRFYKPIPEYEGIHRWDPDFDWTEEEEKRLVRKVVNFRTPPLAASLDKRSQRLRLIGECVPLLVSHSSRYS